MSKKFLTTNASYNPLDLQSLMQLSMLAENRQREIETSYGEIADKTALMESIIDPNKDVETYSKYQNYKTNLDKSISSLASEGLAASSSREFMQNRKDYQSNIAPIEMAAKKKMNQAAIHLERKANDPFYYADRDPNDISLDEYIANPNLLPKMSSLKPIAENLKLAATGLAQQIREGSPEITPLLKGMFGVSTYDVRYTKGLTPEDIAKIIIQDKDANPYIAKLIDDAVGSAEFNSWNLDEEDLTNRRMWARERLIPMLNYGIGGDDVKQMANPDYNYKQQIALQDRAARKPVDPDKAAKVVVNRIPHFEEARFSELSDSKESVDPSAVTGILNPVKKITPAYQNLHIFDDKTQSYINPAIGYTIPDIEVPKSFDIFSPKIETPKSQVQSSVSRDSEKALQEMISPNYKIPVEIKDGIYNVPLDIESLENAYSKYKNIVYGTKNMNYTLNSNILGFDGDISAHIANVFTRSGAANNNLVSVISRLASSSIDGKRSKAKVIVSTLEKNIDKIKEYKKNVDKFGGIISGNLEESIRVGKQLENIKTTSLVGSVTTNNTSRERIQTVLSPMIDKLPIYEYKDGVEGDQLDDSDKVNLMRLLESNRSSGGFKITNGEGVTLTVDGKGYKIKNLKELDKIYDDTKLMFDASTNFGSAYKKLEKIPNLSFEDYINKASEEYNIPPQQLSENPNLFGDWAFKTGVQLPMGGAIKQENGIVYYIEKFENNNNVEYKIEKINSVDDQLNGGKEIHNKLQIRLGGYASSVETIFGESPSESKTVPAGTTILYK